MSLRHRVVCLSALSLFFFTACGEPDELSPGADEVDLEASYQALYERLARGEAMTAQDRTFLELAGRDFQPAWSDAMTTAVEAFVEEVEALQVPTAELLARAAEFETLEDPVLTELHDDLRLYLSGPDEGPVGVQEYELGPPCAIAACAGGVIHCTNGAGAAYDLCLEQKCPRGKEVSKECCAKKKVDDVDNCWWCGLDDALDEEADYDRMHGCCVDVEEGQGAGQQAGQGKAGAVGVSSGR